MKVFTKFDLKKLKLQPTNKQPSKNKTVTKTQIQNNQANLPFKKYEHFKPSREQSRWLSTHQWS
jgi:hypothetical protein